MFQEDEFWGVINPDALYTLEAIKRRLGIRQKRRMVGVHYTYNYLNQLTTLDQYGTGGSS